MYDIRLWPSSASVAPCRCCKRPHQNITFAILDDRDSDLKGRGHAVVCAATRRSVLCSQQHRNALTYAIWMRLWGSALVSISYHHFAIYIRNLSRATVLTAMHLRVQSRRKERLQLPSRHILACMQVYNVARLRTWFGWANVTDCNWFAKSVIYSMGCFFASCTARVVDGRGRGAIEKIISTRDENYIHMRMCMLKLMRFVNGFLNLL